MKKICQKLSRILKCLGLGFGLESFANFWRVSVSENLFSEKKSQFWLRKIWSRKKSIGFSFGEVGLEKKVSVSVLENFVSEKKCRYRFLSNFWYRHSVTIRDMDIHMHMK